MEIGKAAMRGLTRIALAAALCAGLNAAWGAIYAQSGTTIAVKVLDGRTGKPVKPSNFLVKIDHRDTNHNDWVKINDDGTVTVTVPDSAKEVSVKATYELGMETYVNCDAAKEANKERDIWYPIATILKSGVVAPNECSKTEYTAQPGEFIFFVRKRSWRDKIDE